MKTLNQNELENLKKKIHLICSKTANIYFKSSEEISDFLFITNIMFDLNKHKISNKCQQKINKLYIKYI